MDSRELNAFQVDLSDFLADKIFEKVKTHHPKDGPMQVQYLDQAIADVRDMVDVWADRIHGRRMNHRFVRPRSSRGRTRRRRGSVASRTRVASRDGPRRKDDDPEPVVHARSRGAR